MEDILGGHVISYDGYIEDQIPEALESCLEKAAEDNRKKPLYIILRTFGGSATGAERIVNAIRYRFKDVIFVIDEYAMSAGTMIALSGNDIMMHHNACLGPIDPQVYTRGRYLPAGGFLDEYDLLKEKEQEGALLDSEFAILTQVDLAEISMYKSEVALSATLVARWLEDYKFRDWKQHNRTKKLVTAKEKKERAEKIASELSNFKRWHSHSRPLGLDHLKDLRIKVTNYSKNKPELHSLIGHYREVIKAEEFITEQFTAFVHSKNICPR